MKKTSFTRHSALVPRGFRAAGAALAAAAIAIMLLRGLAPGFFITVAAPLWRASAALAGDFHDLLAVFAGPAALQERLDAVKAENEALRAENAALAAKARDLSRLIGSRAEPAPGIPAGVLVRPPESPYDSLIIDAGTDEGVMNGAEAFGPGGIPIGRVASVVKSSARVALFSSSGAETSAWVGEGRVPLTLAGLGGGAFQATAPKDAGIVQNDIVYVAGPGALPFGTVVRVDTDASSPSATLRIRASVNPFTLAWISVARTTP